MKTLALLPLCLLALFATACSSYQLGSAPLPFKKLYVEPARNDSFAPQTQIPLTQQLIQTLMRDARVKIVTKDEADAILQVTLSDYNRNISATSTADTALARSYDLRLMANVSLMNTKTGEPFFKDRTVSAVVTAYNDNGFQPEEYQSIPTLTRQLAESIRTEVLSTW